MACGRGRHRRELHPHACGENAPGAGTIVGGKAPPPRVWGKLGCTGAVGSKNSSTPTRVGKTPCVIRGAADTVVHPHACGENICYLPNCSPLSSPPPRVWGKLVEGHVTHTGTQSTPTRVGKTSAFGQKRNGSPVHPHACGENVKGERGMAGDGSPPPRVWGKLALFVDTNWILQSTPTRVGKTPFANVKSVVK